MRSIRVAWKARGTNSRLPHEGVRKVPVKTQHIKRSLQRFTLVLATASTLGGCASLEEAKDAVVYAADSTVEFSKNVFDTTKPHVEKAVDSAVGALGDLYAQRGAFMSDLFGDPQDNKAAYEELIDSCPQALEPIRNAAQKTDISANYLLALARQESSCNSHAKAKTTTAAGMFQFLEQTWLVSVNNHGGTYGYGQYADQIRLDRGKALVYDKRQRVTILDKRYDAEMAALMAAELARDNYRYLKRSINRPLQPTDLYMAHFLGAGGAKKFLVALANEPASPAAELFPSAARANRAVFYADESRSRSVREVHTFFQGKIEAI